MGVLTRIFFGAESRTLDLTSFGELVRALRTGTGVVETTSPATAMQIAAVYACVRVIATNIATLPLVLMRRNGNRREVVEDHPLARILRWTPNPEMTSIQFRMALGVHLALYGNAYAQIVFDGGGRVRELWPLRPDRMSLERTRSGELIYQYSRSDGGVDMLTKREVMHIAHMSFDGLIGLSPIALARRAFDTKARMEEYSASFWQNDASPGIVLRYPGTLNAERISALRKAWEDRHRGPGAAGRTAVLDGGVEITTLSIPQTDAQFLESQKFTRQEIAALFGVPAHMINDLDRATFSNIEEQAQEFVDYTLMPYIEGWQQAIYRDLLTEEERRAGYYAHFRTQALLRGKHIDRAQYYSTMQQIGAMSPNDIRQLEDMNPIDGGDIYLVPLNMTTVQKTQDEENALDSDAVARGWLEVMLADVARRLRARITNDVRQGGGKALRTGGRLALSEWSKAKMYEWRQAGEGMLMALVNDAVDKGLMSAEEVFTMAEIEDWITTAYQNAVKELLDEK
ncbi:MAG: phage portal protein [Roseiflexus sp.]|jgi:HK97 family phage portal protein|nr:phage portal protein [Roseiflexus sp.]